MNKNKAIFAGTSHTEGLGLELEFSKRYQDDNYLTNECKSIPPVGDAYEDWDIYTEEDRENHKKYRWSTIVSDYFNLEQININDKKTPYEIFNKHRNAIDLILDLPNRKNEPEVIKVLSDTQYIFLEFGYIRWWDQNLHGNKNGKVYPETPSEIKNFIENPNTSNVDKRKAIEWVNNNNSKYLWNLVLTRIDNLIKNFSDIEVILLGYVNRWGFDIAKEKGMIDLFLNIQDGEDKFYSHLNIPKYISDNKLQIKDKVLAYNSKYKNKWIYLDEHPNSDGHKLIANKIIERINK